MTLYPYGLIISLAILAGAAWTAREFQRAGEDPDEVWAALPWVVIFGLLGARLYHVLHYWNYYAAAPLKILEVWHGGLGIYGGLAGGLAGLVVYSALPGISGRNRVNPVNLKSKIYNLKFGVKNFRFSILDYRWPLSWLNFAAPGLALGQAIGRVGNLLNREILPFAAAEMVWDLVIFIVLVNWSRGGNAADKHPQGLKERPPLSGAGPPRISPSPSAGRWRWKVSPSARSAVGIRGFFAKRLGGVYSPFKTYLFLYGTGRFFLEFLRTDNVWRLGALTTAQWVSLLILGVVLAGWPGKKEVAKSRPDRLR